MDMKKNHSLIGKEHVYDQELIYACVIGLLPKPREINFDNLLTYEFDTYHIPISVQPITRNQNRQMNPETKASTDDIRMICVPHMRRLISSLHNLSSLAEKYIRVVCDGTYPFRC